jgi:hypothetical protein
MSDQSGPPPGVDPGAWSRWLERRGQPIPFPAALRPDAATRPDGVGPEAAGATWLDDLRARVEAARAGGERPEPIEVGVDDLVRLLARVDRLEAALRRYGQHAVHCASRGGPARGEAAARCTCGLDDEVAGQ